jgi:hypothetical protein
MSEHAPTEHLDDFDADPQFIHDTIDADMKAGMILGANFTVGLLTTIADAITNGRDHIDIAFAGSPYEPQTRIHLANALTSIAETVHSAVPTTIDDVRKAQNRLDIHRDIENPGREGRG